MYQVVYVTCKKMTEARKITKTILEEKLAACVSMVPGVESTYWWEGKLQKDIEVFMMIKTKKSLVKALIQTVKSLHSYATPEILSLAITDGHKDYLKWIDASCTAEKLKTKKRK